MMMMMMKVNFHGTVETVDNNIVTVANASHVCLCVSGVRLMMVSASCPVQEAGFTLHMPSCHMDHLQTTLTALVRCLNSVL